MLIPQEITNVLMTNKVYGGRPIFKINVRTIEATGA